MTLVVNSKQVNNQNLSSGSYTWTPSPSVDFDKTFGPFGYLEESLSSPNHYRMRGYESGSNWVFECRGANASQSVEMKLIEFTAGSDFNAYRYAATPRTGVEDSGTTDGVSANKLIQSGQNFITTVSVGDIVHNTVDDTFAKVTAVDSDTQLSLNADIMASGEAYEIIVCVDVSDSIVVSESCLYLTCETAAADTALRDRHFARGRIIDAGGQTYVDLFSYTTAMQMQLNIFNFSAGVTVKQVNQVVPATTDLTTGYDITIPSGGVTASRSFIFCTAAIEDAGIGAQQLVRAHLQDNTNVELQNYDSSIDEMDVCVYVVELPGGGDHVVQQALRDLNSASENEAI
ncbi:MAG: hypothetical protein KAJ19_18935, partial [Gammaproteobacteria bacterium]|nr:hypothetical protein [Gammaproteobacteria bacterium]